MQKVQSLTTQQEFSFNPEKHQYTLNGLVIPSVTQIIRCVLPNNLVNIPPHILQEAAQRGTEIHSEIETGFIQSIEANWIEKNIDRKNCDFEKMFYCELAGLIFAGTADIVGGNILYDIKTQSTPDLLSWTLQLNLYNVFFQKEKLQVLHTPKSGNYKTFDIPVLPIEKLNEVIFAYTNNQLLRSDFMEEKKAISTVQPIKLELVVTKQNIGELTTNAIELKALVKKQLEYYTLDNYNSGNISIAKKDKAELNRAAKMLNDKRIEIERAFMNPIEEFKLTVNDTVKLIKECSAKIDGIVKGVEQEEKQNKKALLQEYFFTLNFNLVDFEKIFNEKWLNKTAKIEEIKKEINDRIEKIKSDLTVLDHIGEAEAKNFYLSVLDLDAALNKANEIKANRERLLKIEAEKQAPINITPQETSTPLVEEDAQEVIDISNLTAKQETEAPSNEPEKQDMYCVTFKATGTKEQLEKLQHFMNSEKIEYQF